MDVIKLPFGEESPADTDCISIMQRADGRHDLVGSALLQCGDTQEVESVSLICSQPYDSYDEAEAAGLAWADGHCVETLYVSSLPVGQMAGA